MRDCAARPAEFRHDVYENFMKSFLIRWIIGQSQECRLDAQAISLLEVSVRAARAVFPEAQFVICHNNLGARREDVLRLSCELGIEAVETSNHLPGHLPSGGKNSWWKYAPPRLLLSGHELVLDNDIILWKRPSVLEEWLDSDCLLGLGVEGDDCREVLYYGDYAPQVRAACPSLDLNAGLIGWPPGYRPAVERYRETADEYFHTEQGFTAWLFATFEGRRKLVPYSAVPLLHTMRIGPKELAESCCGAHFCECNFGEMQYWREIYEKPVREFVGQLGAKNGQHSSAQTGCKLAHSE